MFRKYAYILIMQMHISLNVTMTYDLIEPAVKTVDAKCHIGLGLGV